MKLRQFRSALPGVVHEVLKAIGVLADDMGYSAYLVGGIVRDMIIGAPNLDLDIAIEGDAISFAKAFAARTGSVFKNPTRFGTCKVETKAYGQIDFSTTRSETYRRPGALPEVYPADIATDLGRRDFSINAMAISLSPRSYGMLVDPHRGYDDISKRLLRVLHDRSFQDDPTRILRGVRFAARYELRFEARTARLLRDCLKQDCLHTISGDRVFHEIRLICSEPTAIRGLAILGRLGVLDAIVFRFRYSRDFVANLRRVKAALARLRPHVEDEIEEWVVWFATLAVGSSPRMVERRLQYLRPPSHASQVCTWLASSLKSTLRKLDRSKRDAYRVSLCLRGVPLEALIHLYAVSGREHRRLVSTYLSKWRHVKPLLTGGEIVRMGLPQGQLIGKVLGTLTRLRLLGKVRTREHEIEVVKTLISRSHMGRRY